jgi:hypothetical protein
MTVSPRTAWTLLAVCVFNTGAAAGWLFVLVGAVLLAHRYDALWVLAPFAPLAVAGIMLDLVFARKVYAGMLGSCRIPAPVRIVALRIAPLMRALE